MRGEGGVKKRDQGSTRRCRGSEKSRGGGGGGKRGGGSSVFSAPGS